MVKPKILMVCDVKGWAWWIKSTYIKKYLDDEFDISLMDENTKITKDTYDLYFTYAPQFIKLLPAVPKNKILTGYTAHRDFSPLKELKNKLAGFHANSMLIYNQMKKIVGEEKLFYIPNGVDTELFKPTNPLPIKFVAGHVGKLSAMKGQKEIIEPAVKQANVTYKACYKNYRNRIPQQKLVQLYNSISCFVVASKEDGTPCGALEAMACGRPVLSNVIGNMPEIIKNSENGFIISKDINKYANYLKWMSNHREELIQMGERARDLMVKEWGWEKQSKNYRKFFKYALEQQ